MASVFDSTSPAFAGDSTNFSESGATGAATWMIARDVGRLLASGDADAGYVLGTQALTTAGYESDLCLLTGACAYQCEHLDEAEFLWRQALEVDPQCSQAWFNLGVLFARRGRDEDAERAYGLAVNCRPANAAAHCNLALLLVRHRRYAEAEGHYRAAIAVDPGNADYHCNFGNLLFEQGRYDQAEACYRQAIERSPAHASTYANLGALLARRQRYKEAEACSRRAVELAPDSAVAHCNLGMALMHQSRYAPAEECFVTAIRFDPRHIESHTNFGLLLDRMGRDDEAELSYRRALDLDEGVQAIWSNLGNLLQKRGSWLEAETCYRRAIMLDPAAPEAHVNLGVLLASVGMSDKAERSFRHALSLSPEHPRASLNLGFLLLRQGRFAEGWKLHEARNDTRLTEAAMPPPPVSFPCWQGESLAGRSLLVWPEQGLGDEIQFCRYARVLKAMGVARLTWACRPALKALLETHADIDEVVTIDQAAQLPAHDFWVRSLSLPPHCGTVVETIPADIPYLRTMPESMEKWSSCLPAGGMRVGVVWKGNRFHANDADRSLPDVTVLAPLWAVPDLHFVSLQKGQDEMETDSVDGQPLPRLGSQLTDMADTAAIVQQLDLVICVDTSVAHLAGALGVPCWVLLPAHNTDWRWIEGRDDSPWYPGRMRLFRQARRGEWGPVVENVRQALAQWRANR